MVFPLTMSVHRLFWQSTVGRSVLVSALIEAALWLPAPWAKFGSCGAMNYTAVAFMYAHWPFLSLMDAFSPVFSGTQSEFMLPAFEFLVVLLVVLPASLIVRHLRSARAV